MVATATYWMLEEGP